MCAAENLLHEEDVLVTDNKVTNDSEAQAVEWSTDSTSTSTSTSTSMSQVGALSEHGNRKFDAAKVARIKAQIACGEYEINPSRIVSKIIELKA